MSEVKDFQKYLDMMKNIQEKILLYIEDEANSERNFGNLQVIFDDAKIKDNKLELLSLLHLISRIGKNFHRFRNFLNIIEQILKYFQDDITKHFSNYEIFNIFKSNKRILLFLIEQQIIIFDEKIAKKIATTKKYIKANYLQYFQPEIQPFINEKWFPEFDQNDGFFDRCRWAELVKKGLPENFYEKRKKGENDNHLCELIRNDMIDEFITYITQNGLSLNTTIKESIYETNPFLFKESRLSLIEYAAFFGSIKVFNYLRFEKVELEESLWLLAIHGKNSEIIHSLEENNVNLKYRKYKLYFYESIKCHHNDIANYFLNNFLEEEEGNSQNIFKQSLKYYNFYFLENECIDESLFNYLCKYDYYILAEYLLENKVFDTNKKEIFRCFIKCNFI